MKKQWKKFLDNGSWPYNIVPKLVDQLTKAINEDNKNEFKNCLEKLEMQGVLLQDGKLVYLQDFMFRHLIG